MFLAICWNYTFESLTTRCLARHEVINLWCAGGVLDFLKFVVCVLDISKVQDDEVGDGTTSVVVFACELLKVFLRLSRSIRLPNNRNYLLKNVCETWIVCCVYAYIDIYVFVYLHVWLTLIVYMIVSEHLDSTWYRHRRNYAMAMVFSSALKRNYWCLNVTYFDDSLEFLFCSKMI